MSDAGRNVDASNPKALGTCRLCGQAVAETPNDSGAGPGQHTHDSSGAAFMLDPFDEKAKQGESGSVGQSEATKAPRFGRWGVLGAVLALGLVGYVVGLLTAPSDQDVTDELAGESTEESDAVFDRDEAGLFDADTSDSEALVDDDPVGSEPSGDPNFPPSDEHLEAEEIAALFADGLGDSDYAIAYVAEDGLHTLGPWGTAQPTVETAHTLDQALGNPLISDGSRTWAIDDSQPEVAYIVSARFEVVETELSGNLAFIRKEADQIEIGLTAYGGRQPGVRIPRASQVLAVPGRGLLVAPATGGTFTVGPEGDMVLLSEDRVVSAGLASEVYQRCDDSLICELYASVVDPDGVTVLAPLDFESDTRVTISPDGAHVAGPSTGDGDLRMVGIYEEYAIDLGQYTVLATGWAPDSSFLAVAVPGELMIVPINGDEVLSIPLPADPSSGELLIFNL